MKLIASKSALVAVLDRARNIAERNSTMAILENVRLVVAGDRLHLSATDLAIVVESSIVIKEGANGDATVHARRLYDLAKSLPGESVAMRLDDTGNLEITAARAKFTLPVLPASGFPKVRSSEGVKFAEVDAVALGRMIDRVLPAVSPDISRAHLCGSLMLRDGESVAMVGTDGHRLAKAMAKIGDLAVPAGAVIPRKAAIELRALMATQEKVQIGFLADRIFLSDGESTLSARMIDNSYPQWEQVVPKSSDRSFSASASEFSVMIGRVATMSGTGKDSAPSVKLSFGGEQVEASANGDRGSGSESMPAICDGELVIGAAHRYLADAVIGAMSERVVFKFGDGSDSPELAPIMVTGEGDDSYLCIVMPMLV